MTDKPYSSLLVLFIAFQKIPKGILIDKPDELVEPAFIVGTSRIFFTRRTLKHLAEKGNQGKKLLLLIPRIIQNPVLIMKAKSRRFLIVKDFRVVNNESYAVVVECIGRDKFVLITVFVTDKKYLKNFEILWRTGTSFS